MEIALKNKPTLSAVQYNTPSAFSGEEEDPSLPKKVS